VCLPGRRLTISSIEHTMMTARFDFFFTLLKTRGYTVGDSAGLAELYLRWRKRYEGKLATELSCRLCTATRWTRRCGNIRMGRYSGCGRAGREPHPAASSQSSSSSACFFFGGITVLSGETLALFLGHHGDTNRSRVQRRLLLVSRSPAGSDNVGERCRGRRERERERERERNLTII